MVPDFVFGFLPNLCSTCNTFTTAGFEITVLTDIASVGVSAGLTVCFTHLAVCPVREVANVGKFKALYTVSHFRFE